MFAFDVGQDWFWFDVIALFVAASPYLAAIVFGLAICAVGWMVERRRRARH
jgi:hypothetical protein